MTWDIHYGDCMDELAMLDDESIHAVVTDPPYHLKSTKKSKGGFMGKDWDGGDIAFRPDVWKECLRVLKPGGHILAFGGSRTQHRLAVAIEDAGFEIMNCIGWITGSGFPKATDLGKNVDSKIKKDAINVRKFIDKITEDDIINIWKKLLNTANIVDEKLKKNLTDAGNPTIKNDIVLISVVENSEIEKSLLNAIVAELKLQEVNHTQYLKTSFVQENARENFLGLKDLVISAERLLGSPEVWYTKDFIAPLNVVMMENGNIKAKIKVVEVLKTCYGKKKFSNVEDINAVFAGLIEDLKLTILNQSKTFQNCDMKLKMGCVSAINVIITESIMVRLIINMVNILKDKATDLSKQIDRRAGVEREVVGKRIAKLPTSNGKFAGDAWSLDAGKSREIDITKPATKEAEKWDGWKYSISPLKPALEIICMARKPFEGKPVDSILKHEVGAVNIDATRCVSPSQMTSHLRSIYDSVYGDVRLSFLDSLSSTGGLAHESCLGALHGIVSGIQIDSTGDKALSHNEVGQGDKLLGDAFFSRQKSLLSSGLLCDQNLLSILNFRGDCPACHHFCDALSPLIGVGGQVTAPLLSGVLERICLHLHELECSHGYQANDLPSNCDALFRVSALVHLLYTQDDFIIQHINRTYKLGRYPANLLLDPEGAEALGNQSGELKSGEVKPCENKCESEYDFMTGTSKRTGSFQSSIGTAARFFNQFEYSDEPPFLYTSKASKKEKNAGLDVLPDKVAGSYEKNAAGDFHQRLSKKKNAMVGKNTHPTVKPLKLMRWLLNLVTREGQVVLDPFMGSGSTGCACVLENREFIGMEMEPEYVDIAIRRIQYWEGKRDENND